jgi:tetratricopeptide (TPR) repeat protein
MRHDEEFPSVTGTRTACGMNSTRRAVAVACTLGAALWMAGCASGRRDLPAPRDTSIEKLRQEASTTPQSAEPLYQMALLHYGQHRHPEALQALHEALGRDADYVPALALLPKLLHECGRSAEGIEYFARRPATSWPEPVRLNLALLYADTGNTMQARKLLDGLASGAYADAAAVNLAYLDLVDEDHAAAARRMQSDLARYADTPAVLNNLALVHLRAGRVEEAVRLLRAVTERHPEFGEAQLNYALVLRHYLFEEDGAARAQARFDALGVPRLADPALENFLRTEDTAPPVPKSQAQVPPPRGGRE